MALVAYADPISALDWLGRAFGFEEHYRYVEPDGTVSNAQMRLGEAWIMIGGPDPRAPARNAGAPTAIMVVVDDVDAHHARAEAAGARILDPPETSLFGERQYQVADPEGRRWWFTEHRADVDPAYWGATPAAAGRICYQVIGVPS